MIWENIFALFIFENLEKQPCKISAHKIIILDGKKHIFFCFGGDEPNLTLTEFKWTSQAFYEFLFWGLGKKACITVSLLNFQAWFPATNHLVYDFNEINVICKNNNT